tara:strand:+ start:2215 stop:2691 length:477 start_codon:yes stop_codon:yes gene_type:complete
MEQAQREVYKKYMNILKGMFKDSYESKGIKASGSWGESLATFIEGDSVGVTAEFNSSIMIEKGRKAGTYSNIDALKEWIKVKQGLPQAFKSNPDKFAFIIARKHFLEGVKIPNKHNKGNVLSEPLEKFITTHLPRMWDELGEAYIFNLSEDISQILRR